MIVDFVAVKHIWGSLKLLLNVTKWVPKIIYGWNYLFSDPYCVILYGASGVGKSEFCRSLLGEPVSLNDAPRTLIYKKQNLVLPDGHKIRLYDLPGHNSYKINRKEAIDKISRQKSYGIINVVSYGYHEVPEAKNLKAFKTNDGSAINDIDTQFHKDNLNRELEQACEWRSIIHIPSNLGWIVTVINKADIWYSKNDEVMAYYQNDGEYMKKLFGQCATYAKYIYPYCSIISPFCKKPMLLEFGERKKIEMHKHLMDDLIRLVKNGQ